MPDREMTPDETRAVSFRRDLVSHNEERSRIPHAVVEQVVILTFNRGKGLNAEDPVRRVTRVFRLDGFLIAENDTILDGQPDELRDD